jgi:hypothetical protein
MKLKINNVDPAIKNVVKRYVFNMRQAWEETGDEEEVNQAGGYNCYRQWFLSNTAEKEYLTEYCQNHLCPECAVHVADMFVLHDKLGNLDEF